MSRRSLYFIALGLLSSIALVSAQPGPLSTTKNTSLVLPASMLLTNGIPGLSGPPIDLMVSSVQSSSAQGGTASLLGNQQWVTRYNGPANNEDQALVVTVDKDGNIIVGGYSVQTFTSDFLTIKYTPDGIGIWTNRYDSGASDRIQAIATDGSGGVYVSGQSASGLTTIKYASDGTPVWTNNYTSSSGSPLFPSLAVDNDGNAYLLPSDIFTKSYITIKYDVNGNPAWTNIFKSSPTSTETANDVAVDASGNIFVTGGSFDSSTGAFRFLTIAYGSDGSILWLNFYSLVGSESADRVILDPSGNVIVVGDSQGGVAQHRYAVVEYSNSGALLWTNSVPAANYVGGGTPRITTDPSGNVFLVGATPGADGSSTPDYTSVEFSNAGVPVWTNRFVDPGGGVPGLFGAATDNAGNLYWSIESAAPNGTNYNYVTLKYAANGTPVWTNRYNGPANSNDDPRAMTVDKAGGVYVTGTSSSGGSSFSALDWATVKYADNLRYTPPPNFVGQDTVTFTAIDSFGNSAPATVTVNVLAGPPIVVAPSAYTSTPGDGGLNTLVRTTNSPRTYQMQFTPDALGGLPIGARITGLAFRVITNSPAFPATRVAWSNYQVTLAQAAKPVTSMSTNFSANLLNPVLVKQGVLSLAAGSFTTGNIPNLFFTMIVFDTPYVYQGGDLVMQFTHTGSDSFTSAFLDAATTNSPGYGASFRALSANAFNATNGTQTSVIIVEIVFTPSIAITGAANQVIISGSGGLEGVTYQILAATNLNLPASQWTPIVTNQFGTNGFSYTNIIQPNTPAEYFRVVLP